MSSSPRKPPITGSIEVQRGQRPARLQPRVIITWAITLAWAGNITFLSTGSFGGSVTGWLLQDLLSSLHIHLASPAFEIAHLLIRKLAHLTEYGMFGLLLYHSFSARAPEKWNARSAAGAVIVAGLFSLTDEYHQSFVPGRVASIVDCGIDTLGALLGMVVLYAGRRIQSLRTKSASS